MLVRRRALLETGGFDLNLVCNEDSELMYRIHRHGYRVVYQRYLKVFEFDHRRLDGGMARKTLHSLTRCALLFFNLMPDALRKHDWGYWRQAATQIPKPRRCAGPCAGFKPDAPAMRVASKLFLGDR